MPRSPASIGEIFRREFDGVPNFMTPTIVEFGEFDNAFVYEVSKGKGMEFNSVMFGFTVLESTANGWIRRGDLSKSFENRGQLNNYINRLTEEKNTIEE